MAPLALNLNGRALTFEIDARPAEHAWFALGVRKSGSSIFSSIVNALAIFNGIHAVDLPGAMFAHGIPYIEWNSDPRIADVVWRGNLYIGFRDPPSGLFGDPVFKAARKILLVRDPRDALVSEYFSNAYSHSLPSELTGGTVMEVQRRRALQSSLEDYVLERVDQLNRTVAAYKHLLADPNLLVLRYEDVIFRKAWWIDRIVDHFGWRVTEEHARRILEWADVRPTGEDPNAFVRKVEPGDHLNKLSAAVIAKVNGKLSDVWSSFGYVVGS